MLDLAGLGAYYAPVEERIAWAEELRERALAAGDVTKALTAFTWLCYWHAEAGCFDAFAGATASALELSDRAGHPRLRWLPLLIASGRCLALGQFADCERYVTEVSQIAGLIDDPALSLSLAMNQIMRAKLLLRVELREALPALDAVTGGVKRKEEFAAVVRAGCFAYLKDVAATRAALSGTRASSIPWSTGICGRYSTRGFAMA